MAKFDMNAMMKQAQQMQAQMIEAQEQARLEIVEAVKTRSIPISTLLAEARPVELRGEVVTVEFAPAAGFHRAQIDEPKNLAMLRDALYEVTGRKLAIETTIGAAPEPVALGEAHELSEEDVISLLKDTFDAEEVEEH